MKKEFDLKSLVPPAPADHKEQMNRIKEEIRKAMENGTLDEYLPIKEYDEDNDPDFDAFMHGERRFNISASPEGMLGFWEQQKRWLEKHNQPVPKNLISKIKGMRKHLNNKMTNDDSKR